MNYKYFFIILPLFIFWFLIFSQSIFASQKVVYPDPRLLQPMPADTYTGSQKNMNMEQTKIIKENLDSLDQTLDFKKLEEVAKKDNNKFLEIINRYNYIVQTIIILLIIIFIFILGLRFFQKDKK